MSEEDSLVSVIILNWNKKNILHQCLNSIKENTAFSNYRIIVVDNGSNDGSVEMVRKEHPESKIIELEKNYGFPKGMNIGIEYAIREYDSNHVVLMNNDIEVTEKGWLKSLVEPTLTHNAGVVGCRVVYPDGKPQYTGAEVIDGGVQIYSNDEPTDITVLDDSEFIYGACFLISRNTIDKIGVLDEGFSPYNWEEVDYCMRCHYSDINLAYTPNCELIHHEGKSKNTVSRFHYRVQKKNQLRFILLNLSSREIIRRVPHEVTEIINVVQGNANLETETSMDGLKVLLQSYLMVLKDTLDIVHKRYNRTAKISPKHKIKFN